MVKHSKSISVIIPTFNRVVELKVLLQSLKESSQNLPKESEIEIIISDDSTNDHTEKLIRSDFPEIKRIQGLRKGPGANRNNGARLAKGEWLIFVDDDCYVNHCYFQAYLENIKLGEHKVLEGKIICPDKKNSIFVRQPENAEGGVLASANFAIRRDLFEEIEGFDEDLEIMEDMELASRLRDMNYKFLFCNSAIAYHRSQPKPLSYYLQWIFHFKWQLLLSYKCKLKNPNLSSTHSALITVYEHIIFLIRISYHLFSKFDRDRWLMYTFERFLAWVTLPICLPYLIYWDQLFRLKIRSDKIRVSTTYKD